MLFATLKSFNFYLILNFQTLNFKLQIMTQMKTRKIIEHLNLKT